MAATNVTWHRSRANGERRDQANEYRAVVQWFTGLSASGKSLLADMVEVERFRRGCHTFVLDSDNLCHGLCTDTGFTLEDRDETRRRLGKVAKLFPEAGLIVLSAPISSLRGGRKPGRAQVPRGDSREIHGPASVDVCERRNSNGLYDRARRGQIANFTGVSLPYAASVSPELTMHSEKLTVGESAAQVLDLIGDRSILPVASDKYPRNS